MYPEVDDVLGRGQFGEVRTGTYMEKQICIKTCIKSISSSKPVSSSKNPFQICIKSSSKPQSYSDEEVLRRVFNNLRDASRPLIAGSLLQKIEKTSKVRTKNFVKRFSKKPFK